MAFSRLRNFSLFLVLLAFPSVVSAQERGGPLTLKQVLSMISHDDTTRRSAVRARHIDCTPPDLAKQQLPPEFLQYCLKSETASTGAPVVATTRPAPIRVPEISPDAVHPYGVADIIMLLTERVESDKIADLTSSACINFQLTSVLIDRFRAAGADLSLIKSLLKACYQTGGSTVALATAVKRMRHPGERVIVRDDETPTAGLAVNTATTRVVKWNFQAEQPLTPGRFGKCQYDYSRAGYTISVAENGSPCLDGTPEEWAANVRISTTATPVSGAPGYNYGIRFGVSDDSTVGYWALEVSTLGHFQLSRYRNHAWDVVLPWKAGRGIKANSANEIAVDIRGSMLRFIINGVEQATWRAESPVTGRAGFGIFGYGDDPPFPVVTFANFRVSGSVPPTAVVAAATPEYVDWDLRASQPLTPGLFGKCSYEYSPSGYTISVTENGTTCIDGPLGVQPAAVRISATALPIEGARGYTYGIRFGYPGDSATGYYAFEVSEGGSFHLSAYRMGTWTELVPWTTAAAVHPGGDHQPNTLLVDMRGTAVTLNVNGVAVGSYELPRPAIGQAGFGIIGYSAETPLPKVTFTHFAISPSP